MLFLSMDFGTSAVKVSIVNEYSQVLSWAKSEYPYMMLAGEKSEIRPEDLLSALFSAVSHLDESMRRNVSHVCYDTFSPSLIFLDKDGNFVYPNIITHMDRRSRSQSSIITKLIGNEAYMDISGILPFAGGCSAMTLMWFLEHYPSVLSSSYSIGHLTTYIHYLLTGKWMVDLVNASMMGLYETTRQSGWSSFLIDRLGLEKCWFHEIQNPGTCYGTLLPSLASQLGLTPGVPVSVGTNDVAAAQMGAGNTKPGDIMNTAGSSEMISILTDHPVTNPNYYLRNSALPGLWQIYATTAGGFALDWFWKEFCRELDRDTFYTSYLPRLLDSFTGNTVSDFEPYLTGDRQSLDKKTASWKNLSLSSTRDDMLLSMLKNMQGVLYTALRQASLIQKLNPVIKISGGMVTPSYLKLKGREIPGYTFKIVDDCPILGNVELVKYYLS